MQSKEIFKFANKSGKCQAYKLWKEEKEKKMTLKLQEEATLLIDNMFRQRTFDQYYS